LLRMKIFVQTRIYGYVLP